MLPFVIWLVTGGDGEYGSSALGRRQVLIGAVVAGAIGLISYAAYQDRKRRLDPQYKQKIRERTCFHLALHGLLSRYKCLC